MGWSAPLALLVLLPFSGLAPGIQVGPDVAPDVTQPPDLATDLADDSLDDAGTPLGDPAAGTESGDGAMADQTDGATAHDEPIDASRFTCFGGALFAEPAGMQVQADLAAWLEVQADHILTYTWPPDPADEGFGPLWRIGGDGTIAVLNYIDERTHMHGAAHVQRVAGGDVSDIIAFLEQFDGQAARAREGWGVPEAWISSLRDADKAALCAALEDRPSAPACEYTPRTTAMDWWTSEPDHPNASCRTPTVVVRFHLPDGPIEQPVWGHTDLHGAWCSAIGNAYADAIAAGSRYYDPPRLLQC